MRGAIARIFAAEIVSKIVLGVSHIITIRALNVSDFSRFSYLYATAFLIVNMSGVALNRAMMVQSAKGVARRSMAVGFVVSLSGAAIILLLMASTGQFLLREFLAIVTFAAGYLLLDYMRAMHQSDLSFGRYSLIELARAMLITVATALALVLASVPNHQASPAELLLFLQGTAMLLLILPWVLVVRRSDPSWGRSGSRWSLKSQFSGETVGLFVYFAAMGILGQIEVFVLKRFGTEAELALFSAAFRYYSLLLLATGAANAVLIPLAQRTESAHAFLRLLRAGRVYFILFAGGVGLSIPVLFVLSPWLGLDKYPGFILVYSVLSFASVQAILLSPHIGALMRLGQFRFLNVLAGGVIAASIGLCIILVRPYGAFGAAISYCIANLVLNFIAFRQANRAVAATS
jgi:O-antigen/teichoic acid export membrane protein